MAESFAGCTLSASEFATARDIYARAAGDYEATITLDDERARIDMRGPKPMLMTLLDEMVERESACCQHLDFEIHETATGYRVILSVNGSQDLAGALLSESLPTLFPGATVVRR